MTIVKCNEFFCRFNGNGVCQCAEIIIDDETEAGVPYNCATCELVDVEVRDD